MVAMHIEGVNYSRQNYFKLFSDFFDPHSGLLSVLQSQACTHKVSLETTVNLEILAAKIFSFSTIIDILANINFSDLYIHRYLANLARISSS